MKKEYTHIIHEKGECPSIDQLQLYHTGTLLPKERFEIENHLLSCEICQDLLEGIINIDTNSLDQIEKQIQTNLNQLLQKNGKTRALYIKYLSLAASLLLVISISFLIFQDKTPRDELAIIKTKDSITIPLFKPEIQKSKVQEKIINRKKNIAPREVYVLDNISNESFSEINEVAIASKQDLISDTQEKVKISATISSNKKITGIVKDERGNPLAGATVQIPGTTIGTITDLNGKFELQKSTSETKVQVSYVGYITENRSTKDDTALEFKLSPDMVALNEVVVVGYGVKKRSMVTGSSSGITKNEQEIISPEESDLLELKIDSLNAILKITPSDWNTKKLLAQKYIELHNSELSIKTLEELNVSANDTEIKQKIEEALILVRKAKYKKALKILRKI